MSYAVDAAVARRAAWFDRVQGETPAGCEGGCGRQAAPNDDFCGPCSREAARLFGWTK